MHVGLSPKYPIAVGAPHWPIAQVQELAGAKRIWVQKTRAADFFLTTSDAIRVAREVVMALTNDDFSHSTQLTVDLCDVYGIVIDGDGWFLKLCVDVDVPELLIVSLHPLERPLKTNRGMVNP